MDKSRFYLLPKDILIELLHKVYENLDGFSMKDIYRLQKECKKRIDEDKKEKEAILYNIYKINDNLTMYYSINKNIILEDSRINNPKTEYGMVWHKKSIFQINVGSYMNKFSFHRNINGIMTLFPNIKNLEELIPHIIEQLSTYGDEIIQECLRIINLILNTRYYLISNGLNVYV